MIDFDISTICIGIIIFAVLTLIRKWYKNKKRYVFQILMFVYLMMVIEKTLFPIEFIDLEYNIWDRINLVPFSEGLTQNGILNIIMTVPFGFLLPCIYKDISAKRMLLLSVSIGLIIESLQLGIALIAGFTFRIIDIDDVIFNFIGSIIGYGIYLLVGFCVKLLHSANTNKDGKV